MNPFYVSSTTMSEIKSVVSITIEAPIPTPVAPITPDEI